jgi:predicted enzyme related to lactoylglutathione lyase
MYLENLVVDAVDPQRLGRFWEAVVGGEQLTDEPAGYETRLAVEGGPVLDLCFQRVADPSTDPPRLRPHLAATNGQDAELDRLLALGAQRTGAGGDGLLVDPEGNPVGVTVGGATYAGTGPLAALRLESADPARDAAFWSWLSGWTQSDDATGAARSLRHPSGKGFVLELHPEVAPKGRSKNRMHLDLRLEPGDDADAIEAAIAGRGGARFVRPEWGELPWRSYTDPSGNEFCVLRAPS